MSDNSAPVDGDPVVRVLLVEDDPDDAFLVAEAMLGRAATSYHVRHVARLGEAVEALRDGSYDIVLLDLGLPDSAGLRTFDTLHAHAVDLPVVMITGLDDDETALQAVSNGAQDYLIKGRFDRPLLERAIRYAIERHRLLARMRSGAFTDELTGLYNRRGLHALADSQLKLARRKRREMTILYVDLDGLKTINDTLGHPTGDQALRDAADLLRETFRASDVVARVGGDEFVVVAVEAPADHTDLIATRLEAALDAFRARPRPYVLSFSYGIVPFDPEHPAELDELLRRADDAMYLSKRRRSIERDAAREPAMRKAPAGG